MPSIATKFSIRQLAFIFLLSHYMLRPLRAILRWDIQLDVSMDYLLMQRIRCTCATRCRDVTCCTSVPRLCIPRGGFLGDPPSFVACQSISVVVIWAVGSGGFFCFSPLIACLFFVACVLSMLEMQVTCITRKQTDAQQDATPKGKNYKLHSTFVIKIPDKHRKNLDLFMI
jgi:hypothetical protein